MTPLKQREFDIRLVLLKRQMVVTYTIFDTANFFSKQKRALQMIRSKSYETKEEIERVWSRFRLDMVQQRFLERGYLGSGENAAGMYCVPNVFRPVPFAILLHK